jgi:hypothetical protein
MPLHSILGYVVVGLAALGFVLALVALSSRSKALSRLMYLCFILCGLIQIPTLVSGVIDNAASSTTVYEAAAITTAADVAPFNFFVGASFFTLTLILVAWRGVNPGVVWDSRKWLIYLATALGHVLLGVALIWLGRLALV